MNSAEEGGENRNAAELVVERVRIRNDFADGAGDFASFAQRAEVGQGCGAEYHGNAVIFHQFVQRLQAREEEVIGQGLRLVQHNHAVGQIVQFPAARGAGGKQAFKQLHIGGDDQGGVPVFGGESVFLRVAVGVVGLVVAVVLQHGAVAQRLAENLGGLLDNAGERNGV